MKFSTFLTEQSKDQIKYTVEIDLANDDMQREIDKNIEDSESIVSSYVSDIIGKSTKVTYKVINIRKGKWPEVQLTGNKKDLIKVLTKYHGKDIDEANSYFDDYAEQV